MLRQHFPELRIRVINVTGLMTLQPQSEHLHGLSDKDLGVLFTKDKPVIFGFHGYPWLIQRLTYRWNNQPHLHVRGYKEEGANTTPIDMSDQSRRLWKRSALRPRIAAPNTARAATCGHRYCIPVPLRKRLRTISMK